MDSRVVIRSDPQLQTLTCMFGCNDVIHRNVSAVARHLFRHHPERADFPLLKMPYDADRDGSIKVAQHVLNEIDCQIFLKLKLGSAVKIPAFKKINIKVMCPPGAFYSIIQSFDLQARWTPAGNVLIQNVTGNTIARMVGASGLQREFPSFKAVVDLNQTVKLRLMATLVKDHTSVIRREIFWLKFGFVARTVRRRALRASVMDIAML